MAIDTLLPSNSSDSQSTSTSNEATTPSTSPTNTLIIASLPPPFFHPRIQAALRTHFEAFGEIHTWAPLTGFGRIMVVYWEDDAVEGAKGLDGVVIGPRVDSTRTDHPSTDGVSNNETSYTLRVFRALPTPLSILNSLSSPTTRDPSYYLAPPPLEKNFLISPPGSPPIGWEQIAEDPPNAAPLAEDLLAALERLELNRGLGGASGGEEDGRAVLVRAEEVDGGVGVWVEDVEKINGVGKEEEDEHEEGDWYNPPAIPGTVPRTARPPVSIPHTAMPPPK